MPKVADILVFGRQSHAARLALTDGPTSLTYSELAYRAGGVCAAIRAEGLAPGDVVTLYGPNSWQWVVAYFAILGAGCVVNPVNMLFTEDELDYVVGNCSARLIIAGGSCLQAAERISKSRNLKPCVALDGPGGRTVTSWSDSSRAFEPVERSELDLAAICYTSGTTGRPKGAMLSQQSVFLNARLSSMMHGKSTEDVVISALPLPHVYGNVVLNGSLLAGAHLLLFAKFDSAETIAAIEGWEATMVEGVPTMYYYLLDDPGLAAARLSSLRICTVGGQSMPRARMLEAEERLGCPLIELWGMTELAGLGTTFAYRSPRRLGSIGVALPYCQARVAPLENGELANPSTGELQLRGPIVMNGYLGNPEATAEVLDADGWLSTGDIARIDPDGMISIVDRKKEMILSAGYNIYPSEVESVIAQHPCVGIVAVGATKDPIKGEVPVAYVVLRPDSALSIPEIEEFCRQKLAAYKVPREFHFVSDLPRTSTGKIRRLSLAELNQQSV